MLNDFIINFLESTGQLVNYSGLKKSDSKKSGFVSQMI